MKLRRELFRLFWQRFFANEFTSSPDGLRYLLITSAAMVAAITLQGVSKLFRFYFDLHLLPSPEPFIDARAGGHMVFLAITALFGALAVVLRWRSLYPDATDLFVLGPMPIPRWEIYLVKFAAVLSFGGIFVMGASILPALTLPIMQTGKHDHSSILLSMLLTLALHLMVGLGIVCALTALEGGLRFFFGGFGVLVAGGMQPLLLTACLIALPHLPSLLVRGSALRLLMGDTLPAWLSFFAPWCLGAIASCLSIYVLNFWRNASNANPLERTGSSLLPRMNFFRHLSRQPAVRGCFSFLGVTLARAPLQKLLFAAWCGISFVFITVELNQSRSLSRATLVFVTMSLIFWTLNGLQYVFSIPAEPKANWIFRVQPAMLQTRAAQVAVERFFYLFAWLPLVVVVALVNMLYRPNLESVALTAMCALEAAILVEILLTSIDQLPFSAEYVPGKQQAVQTIAVYLGAFAFFSFLASVVSISASRHAGSALIWLGLLSFAWCRIAILRLNRWINTPLRFDDDWEPVVSPLSLSE